MAFEDNKIAEFRDSVHQDNFGFTVSVYKENNNSYLVESFGKLEHSYNSFEEFLCDLILKNPLWFTYYYVEVHGDYEDLIKQKLKESLESTMKWIEMAKLQTQSNWLINDTRLGNFTIETIDDLLANFFPPVNESIVKLGTLDQFWNGYCPESWIKGNRVKMRLNKSDFFESEATGLQMVLFSGIQAVILTSRGKGNFKNTITYAEENGEVLCPQNCSYPPFNSPTTIFNSGNELIEYLKQIK